MRIKILTLSLFFIYSCALFADEDKKDENTTETKGNIWQVDSVMKFSIGDSVSNIILEAKIITLTRLQEDKDVLTMKLDSKQKDLTKFLISTADNYRQNTIVFGLFMPSLYFTFFKGKENVKVYFDFGLSKWKIVDEEKKIVAIFDLKSNEILRLCNTLLPQDEFLTFILKQKEVK